MPSWKNKLLFVSGALLTGMLLGPKPGAAQTWGNYGGNAQHTAISTVASQSLNTIRWQTPVDLHPQFSGNDLLIHYGSPLVSTKNTILVPVKTGTNDGFRVQAFNGANGALLWQTDSNYSLPSHNWTPSFSPTLTASGRLYMAGAGGTVLYRDNVDTAGSVATSQVVFYGSSAYSANSAAFNSSIQICTPLTSDAQGNVYFGFRSDGTNPLSLQSGIARIAADGTPTYTSIATLTGGAASQALMNSAPAISSDGKTLYVVAGTGTGVSAGYLVAVDAGTLQQKSQVLLMDPGSGNNAANLFEDGTASPTIGPDGSVYFGVLENPFHSSKGWLLHFNADLSVTGTPGGFGWDDTASIVPASMVASYHGTSAYLLMTKYNNYAGSGGDGVNKLAILDPNDTQIDSRTGVTVMKEVLTIAGVTPDPEFSSAISGAVREWCINTTVVDPFTNSILANSEDGKLYRWDLSTNTFTESITLTSGIGEAYTPTFIGADGTVYAINNATLFAIGSNVSADAPEPGSLLLCLGGIAALGIGRRFRRRSSPNDPRKSGTNPPGK